MGLPVLSLSCPILTAGDRLNRVLPNVALIFNSLMQSFWIGFILIMYLENQNIL